MKYTIKHAVIDYYNGDNKVNSNMKMAIVGGYEKYGLYNIIDCRRIMEKAMSCKSAKAFIKCAEQLDEAYNKQLDKELYDADE